MPGATATGGGNYNLMSKHVDLKGTVSMAADASEAGPGSSRYCSSPSTDCCAVISTKATSSGERDGALPQARVQSRTDEIIDGCVAKLKSEHARSGHIQRLRHGGEAEEAAITCQDRSRAVPKLEQ